MKKLCIFLIMIGLNASLLAFNLDKYGEFTFKNVHKNLYVMHGPVVAPDIANEGFMLRSLCQMMSRL